MVMAIGEVAEARYMYSAWRCCRPGGKCPIGLRKRALGMSGRWKYLRGNVQG